MRNLIISLTVLLATRGTASAQWPGVPSPEASASDGTEPTSALPSAGDCPTATNSCAEIQRSFDVCQADLTTILPILATCEHSDIPTVKKKYHVKTPTPNAKEIRKTKKPPVTTTTTTPKVEQGHRGENGKAGQKGDDGFNSLFRMVPEPAGSDECPTGCQRFESGLDKNRNGVLDDGEVIGKPVFVAMNGKDGNDGSDGSSRVRFGAGFRSSMIWSANRPLGLSAAPEAQLELSLSKTWAFQAAYAYAPLGNTVAFTGLLQWHQPTSKWTFGGGVQYIAWDLKGNKATTQTIAIDAMAQYSLLDSTHFEWTVGLGLLAGMDGYDSASQFAVGGTADTAFKIKF
jgi:hypothetical protein